MRILRAEGRLAVPWRNGGGVTREVLAGPEDSPAERFGWRVSVAEVSQAGPFSRFEEIDRTLLVLAGRLVLAVEGREAVTLAAGGAAFHFAGEAACLGTPVGGAARVLNVMTRRGRFAAGARRVGTGPAGDAAGPCLVVATAPATLRLGGGLWRLAADDAAMWNEGRPWLDGAGITIAIRRVS